MSARSLLLLPALAVALSLPSAAGGGFQVDAQPLLAQAARVRTALDQWGTPLPGASLDLLAQAERSSDDARAVSLVQQALDPHCLAVVRIARDGTVTAVRGKAQPLLVEQGWRTFLIRVENLAELTTTLRISSPSAGSVPNAPAAEGARRWMDLEMLDGRPLWPALSGLELEYRAIQLYSRDEGRQFARLDFNVGELRLPAGARQALIREWKFDQGSDTWTALNQCTVETRAGVLRVTSSGNDPYISAPVRAPGGRMVLRFRARVERDGQGQVFWSTADRPNFDGRRLRGFRLQRGNGEWRDYSLPIQVDGELRAVRLDTGSAPGWMEIESIRLSYEDQPGRQTASLPLAFRAEPSQTVTFRVRDEKGKPAMASFTIRDARGRVYPSQVKRLAPDFFFHPQVYRGNGETVRLPAGRYTVQCSRGPESIPETKELVVKNGPTTFEYRVRRWIDPSLAGWYSGDHHIHAAGCAHYTNPTEGVLAKDMARHIMGEDLKIGANLTWGPGFDYQKQFFTGQVDPASRYPYLLRYDIEVSGFGSHQSGHLCLLRLRDQMYPGGNSKDHWPTLGLNTLRWARRQGAVTGPAHSANGLTNMTGRRVPNTEDGPNGLPNYRIPAYDGIGANEFIVDVTHTVPGPDGKPVPAVDFISTMDTDRRAELNMWYHVLNAGFRVRASGETDFPCISGERVGMGRVYVKTRGKLSYDDWCEGIREGRSYVSDGTHHLLDFRAGPSAGGPAVRVGEKGSEMRLENPGKVRLVVKAAARLDGGKTTAFEAVVNGYPVARREVPADGKSRELTFEVPIERSSWVAIRSFPSVHTNPIWVIVGGKPVRPSRRSVQWCLMGVDQCWRSKERTYAPAEKLQAEEAYQHARQVYRRILEESEAD